MEPTKSVEPKDQMPVEPKLAESVIIATPKSNKKLPIVIGIILILMLILGGGGFASWRYVFVPAVAKEYVKVYDGYFNNVTASTTRIEEINAILEDDSNTDISIEKQTQLVTEFIELTKKLDKEIAKYKKEQKSKFTGGAFDKTVAEADKFFEELEKVNNTSKEFIGFYKEIMIIGNGLTKIGTALGSSTETDLAKIIQAFQLSTKQIEGYKNQIKNIAVTDKNLKDYLIETEKTIDAMITYLAVVEKTTTDLKTAIDSKNNTAIKKAQANAEIMINQALLVFGKATDDSTAKTDKLEAAFKSNFFTMKAALVEQAEKSVKERNKVAEKYNVDVKALEVK